MAARKIDFMGEEITLIDAEDSQYPVGFATEGDNIHAIGCRDLKRKQHVSDMNTTIVENYLAMCIPEARERIRILPCLSNQK